MKKASQIPAHTRADLERLLGAEMHDAGRMGAAIDKAWARGYRSFVGLRDAARHYLEHDEELFL